MKYAIIGAGAMGSLLGYYLCKAGADVALVDPYEKHITQIEKNGLTVLCGDKEQTVNIKAFTSSQSCPKVDVAILLVKGPNTEAAIGNLKNVMRSDSVVITLQNGYGNTEILEEHFEAQQIAYGCMMLGGALKSPGVIIKNAENKNHERIYFGSKNEDLKELLKQVADDFTHGGICSEYRADIDVLVWTKLMVNCSDNGCCGILRRNMNVWHYHAAGIDMAHELKKEIYSVAKAKGIMLPESLLEKPSPQALTDQTIPGGHLTSTLHDVLACRKTENEFMNGAIVREGKKYGVPTPYNQAIYWLLKIVEDSYAFQV